MVSTCGLNTGKGCRHVLGGAFTERDDGAILASLVEFFATIGLMGHADGTRKGGMGVKIPGVVKVEFVLDVIAPASLVEGRCTGSAKDIRPFVQPFAVDIGVDRHRVWWEKVVVHLPVLVEVNLRSPTLPECNLGLGFFL